MSLTQPRVMSLRALAVAVEAEFREMPGLRLTPGQVRRLWSLSNEDAARVMTALVESGRLMLDDTGRYCLCRKGSA